MWIRSYKTICKGLKKEDIWRIWVDVNSWPQWHGDLDYCKMDGPFVLGNHFMLKPKGAAAVKIEITKLEEGRRFTDCTTFFGAKMYDTHEIEETKEGLMLTNTLVVKGPLTFLWVKLVAQHVADSVPQEIETLIELAKKSHEN